MLCVLYFVSLSFSFFHSFIWLGTFIRLFAFSFDVVLQIILTTYKTNVHNDKSCITPRVHTHHSVYKAIRAVCFIYKFLVPKISYVRFRYICAMLLCILHVIFCRVEHMINVLDLNWLYFGYSINTPLVSSTNTFEMIDIDHFMAHHKFF